MKVVIAQTYRAYREYCEHRMLNRADYKFISRPEQLRQTALREEDIHYADATAYAMITDPETEWLRQLSLTMMRAGERV